MKYTVNLDHDPRSRFLIVIQVSLFEAQFNLWHSQRMWLSFSYKLLTVNSVVAEVTCENSE